MRERGRGGGCTGGGDSGWGPGGSQAPGGRWSTARHGTKWGRLDGRWLAASAVCPPALASPTAVPLRQPRSAHPPIRCGGGTVPEMPPVCSPVPRPSNQHCCPHEHRGGWRQADHRLHAQPPPPQGMRAGTPPYGPVAVGRARRAVPHRHRRGDGHRHRRNRRRPLRGGSRRHVGRFPSSGAPPRCKRGRVEKGGSWRWAVRHWAPPPGAAAAATQRRL